MKQTALFLCAALLALVSCNKELIDTPADNGSVAEITFNLTAKHPDGDATKAVKTGWETGDVIFVFFREIAAPRFLKMTYDGSGWTNTQMNGTAEEPLGLSNGATVNMRAVYLPFGNNLTVSAEGGSFKFSEKQETYYLTAELSGTVTDGQVQGCFDMRIPAGYVQFSFPFSLTEEITVTNSAAGVIVNMHGEELTFYVELREPRLTPQGIASIAANGDITHTPAIHGAPLRGYYYDKTGEASCLLLSGILSSDARNVPTDYYFTCYYTLSQHTRFRELYYRKGYAAKTLYRSETEGRAVLLPAPDSWTQITDYLPVDLGCDINIPNSEEKRRIYWSSRNLGASSDFPVHDTDEARMATWGDYYAWGATAPYYETGTAYNPMPTWKTGITGYNWDSYTTHNMYDLSDTLASEDDAASANLGGHWRIPTYYGEWEALADDTRFDWKWDETNIGMIVTSKVSGFEGRSIFLPAAGFREGVELINDGKGGVYWSSVLCSTSSDRTYPLCFFLDTLIPINQESNDPFVRCSGLSVRPVTN